MSTATVKPKKVIFEHEGLSVTEHTSLYQIGRKSNGVVVASVMKYPPTEVTQLKPMTTEAVEQKRIRRLVRYMAEIGY